MKSQPEVQGTGTPRQFFRNEDLVRLRETWVPHEKTALRHRSGVFSLRFRAIRVVGLEMGRVRWAATH